MDPEHDFRMAARCVRILRRDGRPAVRQSELLTQLRQVFPHAAERAFDGLARAGLVIRQRTTATLRDPWWEIPPEVGGLRRVAYVDAGVTVYQRDAKQAVTLFDLPELRAESPAYQIRPLDVPHFTALHRALENQHDPCTTAAVLQCGDDLRAAVFTEPGMAEPVAALLDTGRRIRMLIHPGAQARWPWEAIGHPTADRLAIEDDRLAVVRLVRPRRPSPPPALPEGWLHFPTVEYVVLSGADRDIDYSDALTSLILRAGWPAPVRLDPDEFVAAKPVPPRDPVILHVIGHNLGTSGEAWIEGYDDLTRARLREAVRARRPGLVYLGICFLAKEGIDVASVGRELCAGGVAAVIALRGESMVASQLTFLGAFYDRLSLGLSTEFAMSAGRAAVGSPAQQLQFVHYQLDDRVLPG